MDKDLIVVLDDNHELWIGKMNNDLIIVLNSG